MSPVAVRLRHAKLEQLIEDWGGQSAVADVIGIHRSRITRWQRGEDPGAEQQARLDGLEFVMARLRQTFALPTARKWLTGLNAHLGNRRPIDLIASNRIAEVIAAIEQ